LIAGHNLSVPAALTGWAPIHIPAEAFRSLPCSVTSCK
jgi:hypothetical protein